MVLTRAIVCPPADNFAEGLSTSDLGAPDLELARQQHQQYCTALQQCEVTLTHLDADPLYPDCTFVEDTAILTQRCAILTRPGASSREGEVTRVEEVLSRFYPELHALTSPATLDGGDVCEADGHFFIGISKRTNQEGARQLADILKQYGYTSSDIDIRSVKRILHLKSGLASLGGNKLAVIGSLADQREFRGYDLVRVRSDEEYAANCIRINDSVLIAKGHPSLHATLLDLGYQVIPLDVSEFQKMDGGLSCLSLRF